ncbi:acyl-CoA dehydrogenase family protein [Actinomycetospora soli]|uniref:acyl-CoA dehydrogenase family protein n=1 Tax=Actinomycetospora soli TaxID=2893887 RepID=UPI001E505A32|nr:acyl-CoA dehydrogenase family protein [Actinomycetospora soli]MCD2191199.1 acyl-CoA dehydrogenase family protein [Actinomycetospora soli]
MDFAPSAVADDYTKRMRAFLEESILPAEAEYDAFREERRGTPAEHELPPVVETLKAEARERGLWNLFLPSESGLTNLEYAAVAEVTGWSPVIAPEAINCQAPDTGNMETLHLFGTAEQKQDWLVPLLAGEIRSAFAMTEPAVASSDATNITTEIRREGDEYVVNGKKWWCSGAADSRCAIFIVMGKTDPEAPKHRQQSMVLVPRDTPGVHITRALPVFGYQDQHGHCEIEFHDVRVPASNLLGEEGGGFAISQARLGPGRIHHCMRLIGMAERALDAMVRRANERVAFGKPLADQGVVQQQIAESRIEIDQARLYVQKAADLIDKVGSRGAASEIAAIKVVCPRMACGVIDRAIQVHGGGGVSDDFPLASAYAWARALRLADGPDEVHLRSVARVEIKQRA